MNTNELPTTIANAQDLMSSGAMTAVELASQFLANIDKHNTEFNALLEVFGDVLDQAARADQMRADGFTHPLLGVPVVIKDNILFAGHTASAGSRILANYIASYDSTVVQKLREAGAVIMGRTNMDEFAMGSSGENSAYGASRNPLDLSRIAGGSSSGVGSAVAGRFAVVGIGTDTGGSVRMPASFCGLVGLYPTYGSCSRYGLIAMASSLDQPGPMAHTVADCEVAFDVLSGFDDKDAQSVPDSERIQPSADVRIIGVPRKLLTMPGISNKVKADFDELLGKLGQSGYEIRDIELPMAEYGVQTYYVIVPAEVSTNLARMDGIRFGVREEGADVLDTYIRSKTAGFGAETKRRLLLGAYVLSAGYRDAYYYKALQVREIMRREYYEVLNQVDVILTPTATSGAPRIGEISDPVAEYLMDLFTIPANLTGLPALSVPYGADVTGMPLGVQIMGPRFGEARLFALGKDIERLR
jgi:aspartyl-tRNA(Asn)/glutamyl-tRNA(Gln) amidotransferase subunit A